MESIKIALLEDPLCIYILLAVAELVLAGLWRSRRARPQGCKALAACLLAPIALAGVVFAVETLVVTDREQITAALTEMADSVDGEDKSAGAVQTLRRYIDERAVVDLGDDFGGMGLNLTRAVGAARIMIEQYDLRKVTIRKLKVDFPEGQSSDAGQLRAETSFTSVFSFDSPELGKRPMALKWNLVWIKRRQGWRVQRVRPPQQVALLQP